MGLLIPGAPSITASVDDWGWYVSQVEELLAKADQQDMAYPVLVSALRSARGVIAAKREYPLPATQGAQMDKVNLEQFKLCYVKDGTAYFTSGRLEDAWGDDWNDAPYEHNAETPYEPGVRHTTQGKYLPASEWTEEGVPRWQILRVKFSDFRDDVILPYEGYPEERSWSVEQINKGSISWLRVRSYTREATTVSDQLAAGATYPMFVDFVSRHGGVVWIPVQGLDAAISPQAEPDVPVKAGK